MGLRNYLNENEEKAIKALEDALSKKFGLLDLRLFGSKTRGETHSESDIDVMIEIADSNSEIEAQINEIIFEINLQNDSFISAVIFSRKELQEGSLAESLLYKVVQKEGVPIIQTSSSVMVSSS